MLNAITWAMLLLTAYGTYDAAMSGISSAAAGFALAFGLIVGNRFIPK